MSKKKKSGQETTETIELITFEESAVEGDLHANLEEIRKYDGVIGYVLRNTTSASINLNDPEKITDYAILSYSTFDASCDLSELFDLGEIKSVVVNGSKIRMLSMIVGENKISVFMEKDADTEKVIRKIQNS